MVKGHVSLQGVAVAGVIKSWWQASWEGGIAMGLDVWSAAALLPLQLLVLRVATLACDRTAPYLAASPTAHPLPLYVQPSFTLAGAAAFDFATGRTRYGLTAAVETFKNIRWVAVAATGLLFIFCAAVPS